MQRFVPFVAALVMAAALPQVAAAANKPFKGEVTLVTAVAAPVDHEINGVKWHCEGDTCIGTADSHSTLDSFTKECRKVATVLGPIKRYASRGRELTGN